MLLKLGVVLLPVLLCSATLLEEAILSDCFRLYQAKCCALGDGTPGSGWTPGGYTQCNVPALGSPWTCPNPNPAIPGNPNPGYNDFIWTHSDCEAGEAGCKTEWRATASTGRCKGSRYVCSQTQHGHCSLVAVDFQCTIEELIGEACDVNGDDGDGGN